MPPSRLLEASDAILAIVIPAYKARFLRETLESIMTQSCQDFQLYVGDDCSPEPVDEVVRGFAGRRQLHYVRFEQNFGRQSLVRQWERCIALSREPWIWLFSDDDVMEKDCVSKLVGKLEKSGETRDIFRFDTVFIDEDGTIEGLNPIHPDLEGWMQFAYFWLRGQRVCTLPEHVFSRKAFRRTGGFLELPLAWGSDVATVIRLGTQRGIAAVKGPRVFFRNSGENISSSRDKNLLRPKILASMAFVEWLCSYANDHPDPTFPLAPDTLHCLSRDWFLDHLERQHSYLSLQDCSEIACFMSRFWGDSQERNLLRLMILNLSTTRAWLHRTNFLSYFLR